MFDGELLNSFREKTLSQILSGNKKGVKKGQKEREREREREREWHGHLLTNTKAATAWQRLNAVSSACGLYMISHTTEKHSTKSPDWERVVKISFYCWLYCWQPQFKGCTEMLVQNKCSINFFDSAIDSALCLKTDFSTQTHWKYVTLWRHFCKTYSNIFFSPLQMGVYLIAWWH